MTKTKTAKTAPAKAKTSNKNEKVIALLKREGGASLSEITGLTGWLPHSARAVLTGFRKKGFTLTKSKLDGVTKWSITGQPA